ncbi:MAG: divalent-cation tolerance protein CutA [Euryarchaeota archaeon]|jgi:periplasmic divalent cation tolerance protein|nr:divalent-cation tolerance protein CutA [Euryarchaeota archaeon]
MPTAYITAPSDAAPSLARTLVEERLAACVNRLPCSSTYRWNGEIIEDEEVILLAKTTDERYPDLVSRVEAEHPYEVPCIERFDEEDVLPAFSEWITDSTSDR